MKYSRRYSMAAVTLLLILAIGLLASCQTASTPSATEAPAAEEPSVSPYPEPTQASAAGEEPSAEATAAPTIGPMPTTAPTQPNPELRVVELEWPESLRLGDSDVIRLSLIPSEDGYTAQADYQEHTIASQDVNVNRPEGYTLSAVARLDGAGFEISPSGDQKYIVPPGETVTWRWSLSPRMPGQQRISLLLLFRWEPEPGVKGTVTETIVYDRSLEIRVISFLGLRKPDAMFFGFGGLVFSSVLGLWAWVGRRNPFAKRLSVTAPDPRLSIEAGPGMRLNPEETHLIQALFKKYQRLILQREFLSGYSGARTFLARPMRAGGQADAETIIKIGPRDDIVTEYDNYEGYVKDRLPPVTARIQSAPVTLRGGTRAAIQYTCIAEAGRSPVSLRQMLLENPDTGLIQRLFDTFGPYWWMQRQPYTFRWGQEYDRLLPPHYVLEPCDSATGKQLSPDLDPANAGFQPGDLVMLPPFERAELRADGKSLTLYGKPASGRPALRVRWLGLTPPRGTAARVLARRSDLLAQITSGMDRFGLPDPLLKLDGWLQETISGTRSVIHGDLNLENILVGPGNLVWLIDFAQTREGHPLFDFSHLTSELVAHVLPQRYPTPQAYLAVLREGSDPLMNTVERIASGCQFDPHDPREYRRALTLACLGALKYQNITPQARHYLYLTAAVYGS